MEKIRLLLVDDHTLLRRALSALLQGEEHLTVVGEAGSGEEAVVLAGQLQPDIILMDITLPDMDGLEATRQIRCQYEGIKIIALTMHVEEEYLLQFLAAGGNGYLHKSTADLELLQAIERVIAGEIYLGPTGVQVLANRQYVRPREGDVDPEVLSMRERQVLVLVAAGCTSAEIAKKLFLSPSTIDTYRNRIANKLNLESRSQWVEYVARHRLD
ncbi:MULTISPECIES: response regulator transcription factor [Desulfitobacterium]|uniref:Stage 0 sporulation protein A homolog n=1 Tax=Desulfitobacterium dehalogenans (strain ATCC 51507 / DSM 9161 / JW/IU-DC1) TaxID=756499 RepID=I4A8U5_DESDJ|nr:MULTISPECIES: response regulator transcription factor [Desulfitobacterium]AFM00380.1 response regulator containing a CheY-like receiver domain and an HTH DNA-binding domain [Desulfitobacterium dehalogenans ATCC 51507]